MAERGAGEILLTSMDRDGSKIGYELTLTRILPMPYQSLLSPLVVWVRFNIWLMV